MQIAANARVSHLTRRSVVLFAREVTVHEQLAAALRSDVPANSADQCVLNSEGCPFVTVVE
jgi:hypothetical protein